MARDLERKLNRLLKMSPEKLKDALPATLEGIRRYSVGIALEESPNLLLRIVRRLVEIDAAKFAREAPQELENFLDFLWEGASTIPQKSIQLRQLLESAGDLTVNLEAWDSPFRSHFRINSGRLSGASGLVHFKEQDVKYMGPTSALMQVLAGDMDFVRAVRTDLFFEGNAGIVLYKAGPIMALAIPLIISGK